MIDARAIILGSGLCMLAGHATGGPIWPEPSTDAGALPGTAAEPEVFKTGVVTVRGELTGEDDGGSPPAAGMGDFQDMYKITIADVAEFSAEAAGEGGKPIPFNSQLFLFNEAGMPVLTNDDNPNGGQGSLIISPGTDGTVIPGPGVYFIAISGYNSDPVSAAGGALFPAETGTDIVGPITAGAIITGWNMPGEIGAYDLSITGLVPSPATSVLFCGVAVYACRRRRRGVGAA